MSEQMNYGRGTLAPMRSVKAIVMGKGLGRPPYNWDLEDDWAPLQGPISPPEEEVPAFIAEHFDPIEELEQIMSSQPDDGTDEADQDGEGDHDGEHGPAY